MPSADRLESSASQHEEKDRESRHHDKGRKSTKTKDLSHVPCKFYKVGGCTAGSSCPFSHAAVDPSAQKDTCAWFIKGNCKFGHKCALAHILPGQSMAMDRKNKKAAQQAAGGGGRESGGRRGKREGAGVSGRSNSLLSGGSTAPTRASTSGRPPISTMSLKVSPSAPAPAIKNTDFASFTEALDESAELPAAPARQQSQSSPTHEAGNPITAQASPTSSIPVASPRRQARTTPPPADLGPIGSPPRQSGMATSPRRPNGFTSSPSRDAGSSAQATSSPFSAPHNQTAFYDDWQGQGIAASLGSGMAMAMGAGGNGAVSRSVGWNNMDDEGGYNQRTIRGRPTNMPNGGDEDLEEFIPSSLTDLLTPEERSRRMSRTNSGQTSTGTPSQHQPLPSREAPSGAGHRYSRSVPAPSLLADVRSIWAENPPAPDATKQSIIPPHSAGLASSPNTHLGVPGSFTHGSLVDDSALIMTGLSPSNASAAFLPSIHSNYAKQQLGRGVRNVSSPIYGAAHLSSAGNPARSPFDLTQYSQGATNAQTESYLRNGPQHPQNIQAQPSAQQENFVMSPSTRALQAHAPGQSLPQGLAAGYSRIHALPPPLPLASPSGSTTFGAASGSPGVGANTFGSFSGNMSDWAASTPPPGISGAGVSMKGGVPGSQTGGSTLDQMFSRLSYSAAAKPKAPAPAGQKGPAQGVSPLSQPAAAGADDDDLFSMDNMDA